MLGWHISVYQQTDRGTLPAASKSIKGKRLAVWQTSLGGIDWIIELVREGKAIDLGGDGYPWRFTATAEHLIPRVADGPPEANERWSIDEGDILLEGWEGKTVIDRAEVARCRSDEWLLDRKSVV